VEVATGHIQMLAGRGNSETAASPQAAVALRGICLICRTLATAPASRCKRLQVRSSISSTLPVRPSPVVAGAVEAAVAGAAGRASEAVSVVVVVALAVEAAEAVEGGAAAVAASVSVSSAAP
jgi:hypothetical protein